MKWVILILTMVPVTMAGAQDTGSGLDFLNIGPSVRLLSISEASAAANVGASAIYTNPSLLAFQEHSNLDINYTLWIADVRNQFAAINLRKKRRAYAFGVYSSGSDGFEARDRPGPSAGDFSIRYLSLAGALAQQLGPLSLGGTVQFLREEVFQFRAKGYAVSVGASYRFLDERVLTGISLKNFGDMESLDQESTPLPSFLSLGVSAKAFRFNLPGASGLPLSIRLLADWSRPVGDNRSADFADSDSGSDFFSAAVSADLGELIFIETGYRWGPTERPFSLGLALNLAPIRVNYALLPFSTGFGTAHSFGLQYYFD